MNPVYRFIPTPRHLCFLYTVRKYNAFIREAILKRKAANEQRGFNPETVAICY
jgi:hypothetical protein